jgi:dienelactone hydrolase
MSTRRNVLCASLSILGATVPLASMSRRLRTTADLADLLSPSFEIHKPEGDGPFPTVFQFHGCGGRQGLQVPYARAAVEAGWAAVIVDSFKPRGIGRMAALATVCTGVRLPGRQRAGDLIAALHWGRQQKWVDSNCMAASGWSHGGWTIMDALALDGEGMRRNGTLADVTDGSLAGLRQTFLVYPWCGPSSLTIPRGWRHPVKSFFLICGRDSLSGERLPLRAAQKARDSGADVETVVFPTATHAFDDDASSDPRFVYDQALTDRAHGLYRQVLGQVQR